jgi:hypothetical protein
MAIDDAIDATDAINGSFFRCQGYTSLWPAATQAEHRALAKGRTYAGEAAEKPAVQGRHREGSSDDDRRSAQASLSSDDTGD